MKVFITGGNSGLGKELARYYKDRGHVVGIGDLSIKEEDGKGAYPLDVTNEKQVRKVIENFAPQGVDLLICSAGISTTTLEPKPDFNRARLIFDVNVTGTLNAIEAVLDKMIEKKSGQIVTFSSLSAFWGMPGKAAYSSSKAAVKNFSQLLHNDLQSQGITVTTLCPGFIETPLTEGNAHKMPFLTPRPKAMKLITKAIDEKKEIYIFPKTAYFLLKAVGMLPKFLQRSLNKQNF